MTSSRKSKQRGNIFLILLAVVVLMAAAGMYRSHQKEQQQKAAEQAASETQRAAEQKKRDEERAALQERLAQEQKQKDELSNSLKAVDSIHERWVDAIRVADATSRIALSTPVATLQNIRREAQELTVAPCMDEAKTTLISSMDLTIEGFFTFMTNKGEIGKLVAGDLLNQGTEKLKAFSEQRKQCS